MDNERKINQILDAVKFSVSDKKAFEADIKNILKMFEDIQKVDTSDTPSGLGKKNIPLQQLRQDIAKSWGFREDMKGRYFRVPTVSKKL
jgi:Asp-tRNA(Asn)/Glu-tRNA(Gln) amidotransferase C subunit